LKNRFNRLTSKEWLPFQKSWFRFETDEKLISDHIRFFCKAEPNDDVVLYHGNQSNYVGKIGLNNDIQIIDYKHYKNQNIQYALIDLRDEIADVITVEEYLHLRNKFIDLATVVYEKMEHRRFFTVFIPNIQHGSQYFPFAWDLALQLSSIYSLKDEKIACLPEMSDNIGAGAGFQPGNDVFYCLNFRKDENSGGQFQERKHNLFSNNKQVSDRQLSNFTIPTWFILKPAPRKKDEILHPAKYPEDLVTMFINKFTLPDDNILDPMSGTGSTQVAALKAGRNAYGTELSDFFAEIAVQRCLQITNPSQKELFSSKNNQKFILLNKDARTITNEDFPAIDYLITSPPYWDMLNMKGAENQAKRIERGLQTNYSESTTDLGNIADYVSFLEDLTEIYYKVLSVMKKGSYLTIVVKNIKKKGKNYPFAWDLADRLMEKLTLLPEVFWCQDDINLAPYGYGNTFVSNTFHQYCLNFQKI